MMMKDRGKVVSIEPMLEIRNNINQLINQKYQVDERVNELEALCWEFANTVSVMLEFSPWSRPRPNDEIGIVKKHAERLLRDTKEVLGDEA